jgi:hypothetical protein
VLNDEKAATVIIKASEEACDRINEFSAKVLQTRGGNLR